MKKMMTMMLAISIAIGASGVLLAQAGKDAPKAETTKGKGKGKGTGKNKGKGGGALKDGKAGKAKGKAPETK
jgi:hypothetical protein